MGTCFVCKIQIWKVTINFSAVEYNYSLWNVMEWKYKVALHFNTQAKYLWIIPK